jgi:hypothetical protein
MEIFMKDSFLMDYHMEKDLINKIMDLVLLANFIKER